MKTITINDEIYAKLSEAKATLHARSFSEVLGKILSEDRLNWVERLAGKVNINEKKIKELDKKWDTWHTP